MPKGKKGKKDGKDAKEKQPKQLTEQQKQDLDNKIQQAFSIFDIGGNNTCQTHEIGTILRYLNIFPSEEQLKTWIKKVRFDWYSSSNFPFTHQC